jgi:transcriptional regulator with XRE-family HTH domain
MLLADFVDEALYCELSQEELAELLGVSKRTIQRWTAWLETMNFIRRIQRFNQLGRPLPDGYFLCLQVEETLTRRQPGDSEPSTRRQPGDTVRSEDSLVLIKNININKKNLELALNFPANVDHDKFLLWVDTRINSGSPPTYPQMQTVLNQLAAVEQYESANTVLDYLITANKPGVRLQYWQEQRELRTKKDSEPRVKKSASNQAKTKPEDDPETLRLEWETYLKRRHKQASELFTSPRWNEIRDQEIPYTLREFAISECRAFYEKRKKARVSPEETT